MVYRTPECWMLEQRAAKIWGGIEKKIIFFHYYFCCWNEWERREKITAWARQVSKLMQTWNGVRVDRIFFVSVSVFILIYYFVFIKNNREIWTKWTGCSTRIQHTLNSECEIKTHLDRANSCSEALNGRKNGNDIEFNRIILWLLTLTVGCLIFRYFIFF